MKPNHQLSALGHCAGCVRYEIFIISAYLFAYMTSLYYIWVVRESYNLVLPSGSNFQRLPWPCRPLPYWALIQTPCSHERTSKKLVAGKQNLYLNGLSSPGSFFSIFALYIDYGSNKYCRVRAVSKPVSILLRMNKRACRSITSRDWHILRRVEIPQSNAE